MRPIHTCCVEPLLYWRDRKHHPERSETKSREIATTVTAQEKPMRRSFDSLCSLRMTNREDNCRYRYRSSADTARWGLFPTLRSAMNGTTQAVILPGGNVFLLYRKITPLSTLHTQNTKLFRA